MTGLAGSQWVSTGLDGSQCVSAGLGMSKGLSRSGQYLVGLRGSAGLMGLRHLRGSQRFLMDLGRYQWIPAGLSGSRHDLTYQRVKVGPSGSGQYLAGLGFSISRGLSWSRQVLVSLSRSPWVLVGLAGLSGSRHLKGSQQVLAGLGGLWRVLVGQDMSRLV